MIYEILMSKRSLEAIIKEPVRLFSYPYGGTDDFTGETKQIVAKAGFDAGIANIQSDVTMPVDMYAIPRRLVRNWSGQTFTQWLREDDKSVLEAQTVSLRAEKLIDHQQKLFQKETETIPL